MQVNDSLTSLIGGLGDPTRDKFAASTYSGCHLSDQQLHNAFTSSWMVRKAVKIPADDATRKWRVWQGSDDHVEAIVKLEQDLGVQNKIRQAKILARLWGGSAIVIGNGDEDVSEPLDPERIGRDGIKYLAVLPRRELAPTELERDPASINYGKPKAYQFVGHVNTQFVDFHPSRLVIQYGSEQPDPWTSYGANYGWGESVVTPIWDAMRGGDSVLSNVASLIFEANIDVMRFPNLMALAADKDYEASWLKRTTLAATSKAINKTLIMDKEEEYERKSANFGNLDKIIDQFLRVCAGAADIPMTRFMAQSPAGLSSTGDGDMQNYHDSIQSIQELEIGPAMRILDECLIRSAIGSRPEEISYIWRPLEQMSEKEQAEIGKLQAETADKMVMIGTHSAEELRESLTASLTEIGVFPNLAGIVERAAEEAGADFDLGEPDNDIEEVTE